MAVETKLQTDFDVVIASLAGFSVLLEMPD